ncbi:hypothetical protein H7F15_07915 [Pontibacter sp. Tf4]|uniref:hypothetical protein n=1 Tax=Pontibacter sp. Tf4 TaxID=2761620 RepID=UPI001626FCA2|nr:hypothetical protein [Pontibacter sp. Tf4]MBB6610958.1 hypothetical protein [Pontibacter sp. Tf4]
MLFIREMLKALTKVSIGLGAVLLMFSCSKDMENVTPSSDFSSSSLDAAKAASLTSPVTVSALSTTDGKTWQFTVQKTAEGNVANIGSLLLTLTGCDDQQIALTSANVVSASVTGSLVQSLAPSFKEGNGSACDMSAVTGYLRLSDFQEKLTDGRVYTIRFTLSQAIQVKSATVWTRISNACHTTTVSGPGCDVMDLCGEGQGAFHKAGSWNGQTVTLGGYTYTEAEGLAIMTPNGNSAGGLKDARAAFSQGATVLLNRQMGYISANAYAAELATIDAYLSTLNKLTSYSIVDMPTGNAAAKAAAGYIGDNIKCEEGE